jgi:hypothetical protein
MMNGLWRRCVVSAVAAIGLSSLASATVIQYQPTPNDQQRGVIIGSDGEFVNQLGLWIADKSDGTQSAAQTSLLGPQVIFASNEVEGFTAASTLDVRFRVNNTTPFDLSASASSLGAFLVLRDLTTSSNLVLFLSQGATSQDFSGELTVGHDYALTSALRNPFGTPATSQFLFDIHPDDSLTLVPTPGAFATLAIGGLLVGGRRRRS